MASVIESQCRRHTLIFASSNGFDHAAFMQSATPEALAVLFDPACLSPTAAKGRPPEPVTVFNSVSAPHLPLTHFVYVIARGFGSYLETAVVHGAFVLIDRFQHKSGLPVTLCMMHRLFAAAILVASKQMLDEPLVNAHLGFAIGISTAEMNRLEAKLLHGLGWRALITQADIDEFLSDMADRLSGLDDQRPQQTPSDCEGASMVTSSSATPLAALGHRVSSASSASASSTTGWSPTNDSTPMSRP